MFANLDMRPLMFMTAAIFWLLAVIMFFLNKANTDVKGTYHWAIGNFLSGTGLFLFGYETFIPQFFSIVVSTSLVVSGMCYLLAGLWAFKEKSINRLIFIGFPILNFLQSIVFTYIFESDEIRKILLTLIVIAGMTIAAKESYFRARMPLSIAFRIIAIASTTYVVLMIMRIAGILIDPSSTPLHGSILNLFVWVSITLVQISISVGFLLLFLFKQSMQLQSSLTGMQRFFSILAHDLRGPLGTISNIAEELNRKPDAFSDSQKRLIDSMKKSSANTFSLLEHLLEWGNNLLGDLHVQPVAFNLSTALNEEIELIHSSAQAKQIVINRDIKENIIAFADENMCHTVIRNLLSNAIKYSNPESSINFNADRLNKEVIFSISDSGIGIQPELISELSKAHPVPSSLGTKGEKGFGLGLSFCQGLVEKNLGKINFESTLGIGTTVYVKLPAIPDHKV